MTWLQEQIDQAINLYADGNIEDVHYRLILPADARNDEYITIVKILDKQRKRYEDLIQECKKHSEPIWEKLKEKYIKLKAEVPIFGYLSINYREKYTELESLKTELNERFEARYGRYRVGYNSYIEFNHQLQAIFDDIALTYESELKTLKMYKQILNNDKIQLADTTTTASTDKMYSYPDNDTEERDLLEQKHYSETSNTSGTIRSMLSNLIALNSIPKDTLKRYLDHFYRLFETIEGDRT